jgi:hypothetical protein
MLAGTLLATLFSFQLVHAKDGDETTFAEEARLSVAKLGTGKDARVDVKLRDNTKLKGYVSEATEDSFTVVDSKTGLARTVSYSDVTQVSKQGNGLSTLTKVGIGAAVAAGAIVGWIILKPALCDGGAQTRGPC